MSSFFPFLFSPWPCHTLHLLSHPQALQSPPTAPESTCAFPVCIPHSIGIAFLVFPIKTSISSHPLGVLFSGWMWKPDTVIPGINSIGSFVEHQVPARYFIPMIFLQGKYYCHFTDRCDVIPNTHSRKW